MKKSISKIIGIDVALISIKATTYEGLGEIGEGLAIASEAIVLLKKC